MMECGPVSKQMNGSGHGHFPLSDSGKNDAIHRRDRFINEQLERLDDDALVVNVGCGVIRRFEPSGSARYLATDLRVLANVDFASDAGRLPLADGSVDLVLALELLEHVTRPQAVLDELRRILKPGGTVIISVPSTVPRHDDHDYWRYTAEGLSELGTQVFGRGDVHVFGGTFEALGYLLSYYIALVFHQVGLPSRRFRELFPSLGYWLDRRNNWSTSRTALHTLAFDLLFIATTEPPAA
jgi:SAM-dependent methyltransferase